MFSQCLECLALDNRQGRSFEVSASLVFYTRLTDPQHSQPSIQADTQRPQSSHSIPTTHFPQYQYFRRKPHNPQSHPPQWLCNKQSSPPSHHWHAGVTSHAGGGGASESSSRKASSSKHTIRQNPPTKKTPTTLSQSPGSHKKGDMSQNRLLRLFFACLPPLPVCTCPSLSTRPGSPPRRLFCSCLRCISGDCSILGI